MIHASPASLTVAARDHWHPDGTGSVHFPGRGGQFFRQSVLFRYAYGDRHGRLHVQLRDYLEGHCESAMRLMQTALSAYETVAAGKGDVSVPATHFLLASATCLDVIVAMLDAIVMGTVPPDATPKPSLARSRIPRDLPSGKLLEQLREEKWVKQLSEAADRLMHRGFWPLHLIDQGLVLATKRPVHPESDGAFKEIAPLDLESLALGLLVGLEDWERQLESALETDRSFTPARDQVVSHFCIDPSMTCLPLPSGVLETPSRVVD
jgi:hypothetical protein